MLTITNYSPMKKYSTLSFKSNEHREAELRELRRLTKERTEAERKYILEQRQREYQRY